MLLIVGELLSHLKSLGYKVDIISEEELKVLHESLPIYLHVRIEGNLVYMSIKHGDDLKAILEELLESGENVEETIEEALGYLSIASLRVKSWIERRGYIPVFKLREGSVKVYEALEELGVSDG